MPKGLIFYYFPTKADIRPPCSPNDSRPNARRPRAAGRSGDPATSLVNLDNALNLRDHHSSVMRVIIWREAESHPDVRDYLRRFRSYLHDATVRILEASAAVPVRPGTLRACANAWVAAMFSAAGNDRLRDLDDIPGSTVRNSTPSRRSWPRAWRAWLTPTTRAGPSARRRREQEPSGVEVRGTDRQLAASPTE